MAKLLVMLVVRILSGKAQDSVVDLRDVVFETGLRAPSSLVHVDDSFTHIAMILTNIAGKPKRENNILIEFNKKSDGLTTLHVKFKNMLESIFLHSSGTPIHYIFMTDQESMPIIRKVLKAEIGKYLSESVIQSPRIPQIYKNAVDDNIPRMRVEFVDVDLIIAKHRTEIDLMKKYFGHQFPPGSVFKSISGTKPDIYPVRKYQLDLFYIAPFFHQEFPRELEKLIVLDTDLEFRWGLNRLHVPCCIY